MYRFPFRYINYPADGLIERSPYVLIVKTDQTDNARDHWSTLVIGFTPVMLQGWNVRVLLDWRMTNYTERIYLLI